MSRPWFHRLASALLISTAAAATAAVPAIALTVSESATGSGDFSGDWQNPTVISGAASVSGTWSYQNDYDILALTGLGTGARTVTLTFTPVEEVTYGFSGGGAVLWKTTPFQWGWDGTYLDESFDITYDSPFKIRTFTLDLDDSFGGTLYLGLYGTNQYALNYNIDLTGVRDAETSPVPLPGSILLLSGGLAALAGAGAWRRRRHG